MRLFIKYLGNFIAPKNIADRNDVIRKRLATVYAIVGWNAVMYMFYLMGKDNLTLGGSDAGEKTLSAAKKISDRDVEFVQIKGFNVRRVPIDANATSLPEIIEE